MKRLLCCALLVLASCRKEQTPAAALPGPGMEVLALETGDGMVRIPGGTFVMGNNRPIQGSRGGMVFPEEGPEHEVEVKSFWMDAAEVTNGQFGRFVKATGYVTFAERTPDGITPNGSIIFREAAPGVSPETDHQGQWWSWNPDACWRNPTGQNPALAGLEHHPVVCLTHEDALAYATWAGRRLPTEAEWEYAARGGLDKQMYVWGNELNPGGRWMANLWQGEFPGYNSSEDGFPGRSPVKSFLPNRYGLYDMAGHVWEICSDYYDPGWFSRSPRDNPRGPEKWFNPDSGQKGALPEHRVIKGGSFLCHASYCIRYRPAARQSQAADSPASHTGFRCARD